jgi:ABC-type transport system involved in multi-copper enzyme maturation permease subunit
VRVFVAGLRKLVRRPASFVTLGLLIGLLLLVFIAVGATARQLESQDGGADALLLVTFPGAYELVLGFILGLGGLLALVYGAAIAGSEWSWGTLKNAVARGEGRSWYLLGRFAAIAVMLALGFVLSYGVGLVGAYVGALLAGVPTDGAGDTSTLRKLPESVARGWVALTEQGAIGFAVATVARSQLAGIGVGIAAYFGEQFASIFVSDITKWLPFSAASASVTVGTQTSTGGQLLPTLEANTALLVVVLWLVGALAVASLFTERAEIGG